MARSSGTQGQNLILFRRLGQGKPSVVGERMTCQAALSSRLPYTALPPVLNSSSPTFRDTGPLVFLTAAMLARP